MRSTCDNVLHMSKMIQIRNVPDSTHRALKSRAAQTGRSLSDYLLAEVQQLAELPSVEELTERIRRRSAARPRTSSANVIRRHRNA
jgi:plasmid stability protein